MARCVIPSPLTPLQGLCNGRSHCPFLLLPDPPTVAALPPNCCGHTLLLLLPCRLTVAAIAPCQVTNVTQPHLVCELLLVLEAPGIQAGEAGKLGKAKNDSPGRHVCNVTPPVEGQQICGGGRRKLNVPNHDHASAVAADRCLIEQGLTKNAAARENESARSRQRGHEGLLELGRSQPSQYRSFDQDRLAVRQRMIKLRCHLSTS